MRRPIPLASVESSLRAGGRRLRRWIRIAPDGWRLRTVTLVHLGIAVDLVLLALGPFLFGSGFIIYHNLAWPIDRGSLVPINSVYVPGMWTSNGADPGGYLRSLVDAPAIWIGGATGDPLTTEKVFLAYAYLGGYALAFVAATLFFHWFPSHLTGARREVARIGVVLLFFVNPAAIQWAAGDLIPFLWGAAILDIAILATLLGFRTPGLRYAAVAGLALGFGCLLDPRLLVWGGISVLALYGFALVVRTDRLRSIVAAATTVVFALPAAALTYYAYAWAGLNGTPVRPANASLLAWLSTNADPLRVFELLGYFITEVTYAPPSIYAYGSPGAVASLGSPTYLLAPVDPVTAVWLLALAALPILAFSALLYRSERRYALPFGVLALAAIAFSAGPRLPVPGAVALEVALGTLPIIGSAWQTVVGVPIYLQVETEAAFVPLLAIATLAAMRRIGRVPLHRLVALEGRLARRIHLRVEYHPHRGSGGRWLAPRWIALGVVGVVLLGSWQVTTGTYYPGGYSVGASPNGVPPIGSAAPVTVPPADQAVAAQLATGAEAYAVYWPGATGFTYAWSPRSTPSFSQDGPRPLVEPYGLPYLVTHNLTGDTASLFASIGARYIVLDNMSALELTREFGVGSLDRIVQFFDASPGISLVSAEPPTVWWYQVDAAHGLLEGRAGTVALAEPNDLTGVVTAAFSGAGLAPAWLVPGGPTAATPITFLGEPPPAGGPAPVLVATAQNLSEFTVPSTATGFTPSTTPVAKSAERSSPGEFTLPAPYANWTISVWSLASGNLTASTVAGTGLELAHNGSPATVSVNYLSSLVSGSVRGIPVDPTSEVTYNVSADLVASDATSTATLNVVASDAAAQNLEQQSAGPFALGTTARHLTATGVLPPGTAYFTLRAFTSFSGTVTLANVTIAWHGLAPANGSFSGVSVPVAAGDTLAIPLPGIAGAFDLGIQVTTAGDVDVQGTTGITAAPPNGPFGWIRAGPVTLDGELDLTPHANASIAGLVLYPASWPDAAACHVTNATRSGIATFSATAVLGEGCVVALHEAWASHWRLTVPGSGSSPGTVDAFGQTAFLGAVGSGTVAADLDDASTLSGLLVGEALFGTAAAFAVVFLPGRFWTPRWPFSRAPGR